MAKSIHVDPDLGKKERYEALMPQISALLEGEKNLVACLSNLMAALRFSMDFFWVGCYLVEGKELVLGPFQGPVACFRIGFGQGVCGTAWKEKRTVIVKNVDDFPGHIACSYLSRSEIVVPVMNASNEVALILDLDSEHLSTFDETDQHYLEQMATLIQPLL